MEIKSKDDLQEMVTQKPDQVTLAFPALDAATNEMWSNRFNDVLKECGCTSGQQFLLYTTPAYIILVVVLVAFTTIPHKTLVLAFLAMLFLTGLTGKLVGLWQRKRRLEQLINWFLSENKIA